MKRETHVRKGLIFSIIEYVSANKVSYILRHLFFAWI